MRKCTYPINQLNLMIIHARTDAKNAENIARLSARHNRTPAQIAAARIRVAHRTGTDQDAFAVY